MRLYLSKNTFALSAIVFSACAAAQAQQPQGPPLPNPDMTRNAAHSQLRLGYYASSKVYRYEGAYNITYNAFKVGHSTLYGFADADIEARVDRVSNEFKPDRLVGTFELGSKQNAGGFPLSLYLRHMSAHNIDRIDRLRPQWEQAGVRYQWERPLYQLSVSAATYIHGNNNNYRSDLDLQGSYLVAPSVRHPVSLMFDVHRVGESGPVRDGFTDYWIEPDVRLSPKLSAFVGYGQTHDVDAGNGTSDHPALVGLRFDL